MQRNFLLYFSVFVAAGVEYGSRVWEGFTADLTSQLGLMK